MKKILLYIFLSAGLLSPQSIFGLLPDSIEGWKAADSSLLFKGDDLYKLIDGGADIFREYGFDKCLAARYIDSIDNLISAEIYEMKDPTSAYGIFSLFTFNTGKKINFNCDAYAGEGFLLFQKGKYYASLSGNESSEIIQKGLIKIGGFIEENIQPEVKPLLVRKFDELNYSRIAYLKGNLGLYNLTNLNITGNLRFEEGVSLKIEGGNCTILKYNSEEIAAANLPDFIGILQRRETYTLIDSVNSSVLFRDNEQKYCRIIQYLEFIIICAASDHDKTSEISERIKEFLKR